MQQISKSINVLISFFFFKKLLLTAIYNLKFYII